MTLGLYGAHFAPSASGSLHAVLLQNHLPPPPIPKSLEHFHQGKPLYESLFFIQVQRNPFKKKGLESGTRSPI